MLEIRKISHFFPLRIKISQHTQHFDRHTTVVFHFMVLHKHNKDCSQALPPYAFTDKESVGRRRLVDNGYARLSPATLRNQFPYFLTLCFRRLPGLVGDGLGDFPERGVESWLPGVPFTKRTINWEGKKTKPKQKHNKNTRHY